MQTLTRLAIDQRTAGSHRFVQADRFSRVRFDWAEQAKAVDPTLRSVPVAEAFRSTNTDQVVVADRLVCMHVEAVASKLSTVTRSSREAGFHVNPRGLGVQGGRFGQVDQGEAILIHFDQDVLLESVGIVAGNGVCGGFCQVGDHAPLAIYCIDADIDAKDQSGLLSDLGVLEAGQVLRLDSTPHWGVEAAGQWRLQSVTVRPLVAKDQTTR